MNIGAPSCPQLSARPLFGVAGQIFIVEIPDECIVFFHFRFSIVHVHFCGLGEHFRRTGGVLYYQVGHYAIGSHLIEAAGHEVMQFLICSILYQIRAGFELVGHGFYTLKQRLHLVGGESQGKSRW